MTIKDIRLQTRMTQKDFAEYFNIPIRTLQDWESKRRKPPAYVVEFIKYKIEKERLGMLKLIELREGGEKNKLVEGTLRKVVNYLKENEEIYNWVQDEDPEMELPELKNIETLRELEAELEKVNLDWWELKIEEC